MLKSLELRIRKQMPRAFRQALRIGRNVVSAGQPSPPIPDHLFMECRVCASRKALLGLLPKGGRIAEIGTDKGTFSKQILKRNTPEELHLIDLDTSHLSKDLFGVPAITVHAGRSTDVIGSFADAYFDWIYIDADHSYAGCRADAEAAKTKVKPGGFLVFNDFAHADLEHGRYGVHRAVTEFAVENDWPFAWWAYERHGLYDVALRRPGA